MMDRETQETYAVIAGDYADRWQDRSRVAADLEEVAGRLLPAARLLDLGSGPGFDGQRLSEAGLQVFALDLSAPMLRAGRERGVAIPAAVADMCFLPLPAASFDAIWLNASLLHLPRALAPAAVAQCARVMRPGGLLHIAVKAGKGEERTTLSYGHHRGRFFTYWEAGALDQLLAGSGFTIIKRRADPGWLVRLAQYVQ